MRETSLAATVATQQLAELLRLVHGRFLERAVPFRGFVVAVALALGVVLTVSTLRASQLGDELRRLGMGVGLVLTPAFVVGACAAAGVAVGHQLWRRTIEAERERLAVLPLGSRLLRALALVPTAVPMAVGGLALVVPLLAYGWAMGAGALSAVGALCAGATMSISILVLIRLGLALATGGRATRAAPVVLVVTLLGLVAHALWVLSRGETASGPHALSPLLWMMSREETFRPVVSIALVVALAFSTLVAVSTGVPGAPATTRPPPQVGRQPGPGPRTSPQVRWWGWLLRIGARQGSLVTEVFGMGAIAAGAAGLVAIMWRQGRVEHGHTFMLVCALFAAIPLLGLRAGQGPTQRLVQLGVRPSDGRVGVVVTGAVTLLLTASPSVVVLVGAGVGGAGMLRFAVLLVLVGATALVVGSVFRSVATTSVGRAAASVVFMAVVAVTMRARVHLEPEPVLLAVTAGVCAVLAGTMLRTFRATTVD